MTCLCLTRDRPEWLPRAIENFQAQTFESRELVIVASGADVRRLMPSDPRIRYFHLAGRPLIGPARNFGCEQARGAIVAHWDDDDFSAPGRLVDQVERLEGSGKAVTGYRTMRFTDGAGWWLYQGRPQYVLGTSLVYRLDWWRSNRFRPLQVGEDFYFVKAAAAADELAIADAGELMHATIHARNTSPRALNGSAWSRVA